MKYIGILVAVVITVHISQILFRATFTGDEVRFPLGTVNPEPPAVEKPFEDRRRVLAFAGTTWETNSRQLYQYVLRTDAWQDFADKEIRYEFYDLPQNPSEVTNHVRMLMQRLEIRRIPTVVVLDSSGRKASQATNQILSVDRYKNWIRSHDPI